MNKADRERVKRIILHCELGPLYHDKNCTCETCFFLSLVDKQDKVCKIAGTKTDHAYYCHSDDRCTCGESELEDAIKELEGDK